MTIQMDSFCIDTAPDGGTVHALTGTNDRDGFPVNGR